METPKQVVVGETTSGDGPDKSSVGVVERGESSKSNIDLFVVPHTRMRDLVSWPLTEAAMATDVQDLEPSLQAVYEAMWELKTHEYIENNYIMNRLKARLQTKRVNLNSIKDFVICTLKCLLMTSTLFIFNIGLLIRSKQCNVILRMSANGFG